MSIFTYEQRLEMVALQAWEIITNNGLGLDDYDREHYLKACNDAAANSYYENLTSDSWLNATLSKLRGSK